MAAGVGPRFECRQGPRFGRDEDVRYWRLVVIRWQQPFGADLEKVPDQVKRYKGERQSLVRSPVLQLEMQINSLHGSRADPEAA